MKRDKKKTNRSKTKSIISTDELMDFEFSKIDKFRLDEEWIQQENLVHAFSRGVALARMGVDQAKTELELAEAEIDKRIRKNPVKFGLERPTEGGIGKEVIFQLQKRPEPKALIDAKYKLAIIQAGLDRLMARSKAITDLIYLHSIDYFAQPRIPKNVSKDDADRIKNRKAKLRS